MILNRVRILLSLGRHDDAETLLHDIETHDAAVSDWNRSENAGRTRRMSLAQRRLDASRNTRSAIARTAAGDSEQQPRSIRRPAAAVRGSGPKPANAAPMPPPSRSARQPNRCLIARSHARNARHTWTTVKPPHAGIAKRCRWPKRVACRKKSRWSPAAMRVIAGTRQHRSHGGDRSQRAMGEPRFHLHVDAGGLIPQSGRIGSLAPRADADRGAGRRSRHSASVTPGAAKAAAVDRHAMATPTVQRSAEVAVATGCRLARRAACGFAPVATP